MLTDATNSCEFLYDRYYRLLLYLAVRRFCIPDEDAEALVHDAFVAYLTACVRVQNPRKWLVGTICHLCRHYWRRSKRSVVPPANDASVEPCEYLGERAILERAWNALRDRDQRILRLRFVDEYTIPELAVAFGYTPRYADKVLRAAIRRLSVALRR